MNGDCRSYFREKGIQGKEVTPYILQRVSELTSGRSLQASILLISVCSNTLSFLQFFLVRNSFVGRTTNLSFRSSLVFSLFLVGQEQGTLLQSQNPPLTHLNPSTTFCNSYYSMCCLAMKDSCVNTLLFTSPPFENGLTV